MHSFYSDDGEFSPKELVDLCIGKGIKYFSIADHNSVKGIKEAKEYCKDKEINIIPAVELDCTIDGVNLHVLGYGIEYNNDIFDRIEEDIIKQEQGASKKRMKLIRELGIDFSDEVIKKWEERFNDDTMQIQDYYIMEENIRITMKQFQKDLLYQIRNDNFNVVLQFINEHIQEEISLTEVANLNCMSITHFCKKFKERTGMTLIGYVNQKKVEQIKYYLKADLYSLEQIAEMVGFKNVNYMIRLFKKVTGVTVREYRRSKTGYAKT